MHPEVKGHIVHLRVGSAEVALEVLWGFGSLGWLSGSGEGSESALNLAWLAASNWLRSQLQTGISQQPGVIETSGFQHWKAENLANFAEPNFCGAKFLRSQIFAEPKI